jgi:hypothetical protein
VVVVVVVQVTMVEVGEPLVVAIKALALADQTT